MNEQKPILTARYQVITNDLFTGENIDDLTGSANPRNIIELICTQEMTAAAPVLSEEERQTVNKIANMYFDMDLESDITDINWDGLWEKLPDFLEIPEIAESETMSGDICVILDIVAEKNLFDYEEYAIPLVRDFGRILCCSDKADLVIRRLMKDF